MKKLLCIFVTICMILGMCAFTAFAGPGEGGSVPEGQSMEQPGGSESGEQPGGSESGEQPGGSESGEQPNGGESGGEQPGESGEQPGGGDSGAGQQPGGSDQGAGGSKGPGGPGGSGGGGEKTTISVEPTLAPEEIIITQGIVEPVPEGLNLEGLYIGEVLPESMGDKTVAAGETWYVEDNCVVGKLEIEAGATVEAEFPVIVFFTESSTVNNGDVIGNVQFVNDYDEVVAIIHTNDTHGFIQTEPYVKGLKDQLAASGNYSLVLAVNGGDQYAGGFAVAHIYEGEFIPNVMNKIYDYMTWGNNDAGLTNQGMGSYLLAVLGNETGLTTLLANQRAAEDLDLKAFAESYVPSVGAETFVSMYSDILSLKDDGTIDWSKIDLEKYNVKATENVLADGAIVETALGSKIGLFGESTQGGSLTDAYFSGGMSTKDVAQNMADALTEKGAGAIVGVGHIGWMGENSTEASSNDTNSAQVAMNTTGIDAIIDAHTHSVINEGEGYMFTGYGNNPVVNQASCKGGAVGILYLYLKDGKVVAKDCEKLVPDEEGKLAGVNPDGEVQAAVDLALGRLEEDGYATVYATSEYFLNGERLSSGDAGGGVRANETNLGDLVADAILGTAKKLWKDNEIKIALYPGFWVRSSIAAGDITLIDALSVFANPLKIYYAEYTAEELLSQMTTSCAKLGEENNNMFQVAGLTCKYDPATKAVVYLDVAGEVVYENGEYKVGDDWTVGCAAEVGGGDLDSVDDSVVIVPSNTDMAKLFCQYLAEANYVIYPDEMCPAGRVVPAE